MTGTYVALRIFQWKGLESIHSLSASTQHSTTARTNEEGLNKSELLSSPNKSRSDFDSTRRVPCLRDNLAGQTRRYYHKHSYHCFYHNPLVVVC
jgi:hypothetical protein